MINENKEGFPPETEEYQEGQAGWPALVSSKGLVAGLWSSPFDCSFCSCVSYRALSFLAAFMPSDVPEQLQSIF